MGNRFSRRRDVPVNSYETAGTEQKAAGEPAATTQPGEDSLLTPAQEAVEAENLDVVLGEPVQIVACLPNEACVSECKEGEAPAASAPLDDAEPEPKETEAPVQPEPLISFSTPSPAEPEPEPAPEPVPEPEPASAPEADVEAVPEPEPVPDPAEALEQECFPEPVPVIDLVAPDIDTAPSPALINADEPSDIPAANEFQDDAEAAVISTPEPEKSEETSEVLDGELMEAEAEQLESDVNADSVSGLLQHLDLTGNNLIADLIHSDDVKIPDDIVDTSTSTELI